MVLHSVWQISGNTAVVGAPMGTGNTGKAYIFQRTENGWIQAQVLQAEAPHLWSTLWILGRHHGL